MPHATVDHLVYGAPTLEAGVAELRRATGAGASPGGSHPGRGTENAILSLGPRTYLEVLAPDPAQPGVALPFGLGGLAAPGLRAWAAAPDDLGAAVAAARAAGVDYGEVVEGARRTPEGPELRWRMTSRLPTEDGVAVLPFLIDWGAGPHPAQGAPAGPALAALRLLTPDPGLVARVLDALGVDAEVARAEAPAIEADLDGPAGRAVLAT